MRRAPAGVLDKIAWSPFSHGRAGRLRPDGKVVCAIIDEASPAQVGNVAKTRLEPGADRSPGFPWIPSKIQVEDHRSDHEAPPSVETQRSRVLGVRRHGDAVGPGDPLEEGADK